MASLNPSLSLSLTPRATAILLGCLSLAMVVGSGIYLQFFYLTVTKVVPVTTTYPTSQVLAEMGETGIFTNIRVLVPIPASAGTSIVVSPTDLGKDDLSQYTP